MTYADLIQRLQDWVESSETTLVADLDNIIEQGELRIYRNVDLNVCRTESSVAMVVGTPTVTIPSGTVTIRFVQLITGTVRSMLDQKDPSYLDDFAPDRSVTGIPRYYTWEDDVTIRLAPTPDSTDNLNFGTTIRPAQLSGSETTTWLSLNAPDCLLYSCLMELSVFMKEEPDIVQGYEGKFQAAAKSLLVEENLRNREDRYRAGEIKVGS